MRFFYSEKCIHMILWIANPLCDETACWHAALRVLRAEAAKFPTGSHFPCFFGKKQPARKGLGANAGRAQFLSWDGSFGGFLN